MRQFENEKDSLLLGFHWNIFSMKSTWLEVIMASLDHLDMLRGFSEDIEVEILQNQNEVNKAGLELVLDELNRQLEEWQSQR